MDMQLLEVTNDNQRWSVKYFPARDSIVLTSVDVIGTDITTSLYLDCTQWASIAHSLQAYMDRVQDHSRMSDIEYFALSDSGEWNLQHYQLEEHEFRVTPETNRAADYITGLMYLQTTADFWTQTMEFLTQHVHAYQQRLMVAPTNVSSFQAQMLRPR